MVKYKLIEQTSTNDKTGEEKVRYVVIAYDEKLLNKIHYFFAPLVGIYFNRKWIFDNITDAEEFRERMVNPHTYTLKEIELKW